jgi:hypothetical protein
VQVAEVVETRSVDDAQACLGAAGLGDGGHRGQVPHVEIGHGPNGPSTYRLQRLSRSESIAFHDEV